MTERQSGNFQVVLMIIGLIVMVFLLVRGCVTGDMSFLDSDDDWFDNAASSGKHWDAR